MHRAAGDVRLVAGFQPDDVVQVGADLDVLAAAAIVAIRRVRDAQARQRDEERETDHRAAVGPHLAHQVDVVSGKNERHRQDSVTCEARYCKQAARKGVLEVDLSEHELFIRYYTDKWTSVTIR